MTVTSVHKKGSKLDPGNYTTISLLSVLGNVFGKIILKRMKLHIEIFLLENQDEFTEERGTTRAIFLVQQIIMKAT